MVSQPLRQINPRLTTFCLCFCKRLIFYFKSSIRNTCTRQLLCPYQEGRKEMFYLTTLNTFYLPLYGIGHMVARDGYCFWLAARVLLYAPSLWQDNTYHSLCYTSHGALAGMRNNSMGPPWSIDLTTHRTMSECFYHGPYQWPEIKTVNSLIVLHLILDLYGCHYMIKIISVQ